MSYKNKKMVVLRCGTVWYICYGVVCMVWCGIYTIQHITQYLTLSSTEHMSLDSVKLSTVRPFLVRSITFDFSCKPTFFNKVSRQTNSILNKSLISGFTCNMQDGSDSKFGTLPKLSFLFFLEVEEYVKVAENTNFCSFDNIFSAETINFENTSMKLK